MAAGVLGFAAISGLLAGARARAFYPGLGDFPVSRRALAVCQRAIVLGRFDQARDDR